MTSTAKSRLTSRLSRFQLNPIIIKEMRGYVRGSRAFWVLTGYLAGLGLLAYGLYRITMATVGERFGAGAPPQSAFIGQSLFAGLAFLEMLFICFITPALTAGAISGEIERRTYDMLLATPLRAVNILWGKMVASLIYVLLLILAAIPLSSVIFLFGGVALRDMIQVIGLLGIVALTYGSLGMFFSALTRRTGRAMVLSYLVILSLVFGTIFASTLFSAINQQTPPRGILYVNPISALVSAIVTPASSGMMYGTTPTIELLLRLGGGPEVLGFYSPHVPARPLWQYMTAIYLAATGLLYLLTGQLIKPVRRWRLNRRAALGLLLILALLGGGLWLVFGTDRWSTGWQPASVPPPMPVEVERVVVEMPVAPAPPPPPLPTPTPPTPPQPSPTPTPHLTPLMGTVRVNFQPLTSTVPTDYLTDSGEVFGDRGNGFFYGWDMPNDETRQRNVHPDQRYDTLIHMQKPSSWATVWELAVPNGTYKVTLVMGDAVFPNQVNNVMIEDVTLKDSTPNAHDFDTYTDVVATIDDERLTIKPTAGAKNAKICFVEIAPLNETVKNPDFEDGPYDPDKPPPDWRADAIEPLSIMVWDDTEAHNGERSVRIESTRPNDARWIQTVKVLSDTDYVLSGWIKTQDVEHGGGDIVAGANLDVFGTWDHTPALLGSNDWTYVEVEFNTRANTTIQIACRLGYWSSVASGTAWCDDIELERQ